MTICAFCRWLSDTARGQHWTRWACAKAVNEEINYVSGEVEPYHLCRFVNKNGNCSMFEAGANILHPKEMTHESQ